MIFSGYNDVDASADLFNSDEFDTDQKSSLYSVQADLTKVVAPEGASYSVMGSNVSGLEADMVIVRPDAQNIPIANPFVAEFFAFKYIAIKYVANGASGTITFNWERKSLSTKLN